MPDEKLTAEQRKAVEILDRDVLVTAGAGTGKTRVLTHRFTHLVEQGRAAVDEILALTFTEKAAREMKRRIVERFDQLGRQEDRRRVEAAYIGTIHSFCARVLRENAVEAGVDPYFSQLDDADEAMLQRQVYDQLVARAYEAGGPIADLLSQFETADLRQTVLSIHGYMRSLGRRPREVTVGSPPDLESPARAAQEALAGTLRLEQQQVSPSLAEVLAEVRGRLGRINELLDVREFDWVTWGELDQIAKLFKGNVGTREQKPVLAQAREAVQAFARALLGHAAAAHTRALQELLAQFDADYAAAKDAEGLLDFDDLLSKTRDTFGLPAKPTPTALRYRSQFEFFLMDEFQDTNRLQMAVVEPVVRPGTSFTVGDAKQSIYRFLYADVGVFLDRERRIAAAGGASLPLSRNFRSHPDLLAFTNTLFAELWAEDGFPFGALQPGLEFGAREGPRVEVLLVAQEPRDMRATRVREAEALARRICELTGLGDAPALMLTEGAQKKPASFGDILILFRSTSDIQIYEDALAQCDIPYYTVSGRGFYNTPEVQDLRNLLAAIENPLDDVALAAVLRSPVVGVSDEALYWLGAPPAPGERDDEELGPQGAGRIAARLALADRLALAPEDRARLDAFNPLFADLRELAAGNHVAEVLEQAIRRSDYDLKLLCQRNGRRRYANVEKLRQVALSFQSKARFGLRDFLDYLETLQVLADRETEAPTEAEEDDVVRLMTIHQAKGLEAPIVVVADLGRDHRHPQGAAILSAEGELALRLRNPETDKSVAAPDYDRLEQQASAADAAEDKRLFYVACTRAKEHLLLSGCTEDAGGDGAGKGRRMSLDRPYGELGNWAQWVAKFLGLTGLPAPDGEVLSAGGVPVLVRSDAPVPAQGKGAPQRPLMARSRAQLERGEAIDLNSLGTKQDIEEVMRAADEVRERVCGKPARGVSQISVSVTGAACYAACPQRYKLAIVDRLPEEGFAVEAEDEEAAERDDEDPRERGTRLHDLLRQIDFGADVEQEVERLMPDMNAEEKAHAAAVLRDFSKTELWQQLAQASARGELLREVPFVVRLPGGVLRGQIDALMREGDGWTVIDYKAGARGDDYRQQVALYALACRGLLGAALTRGIIYYLNAGEADKFAIDEGTIDAAAARLDQVLAGIAAEAFERREGEACRRCGYAEACRVRTAAPQPE